MFYPKRLIFFLAISATGLGIAGCGSDTSNAKHSVATSINTPTPSTDARNKRPSTIIPPSDAPSSAVLARVAGKPITLGTVEHLMEIASAPAAVPDPPSYARCIAAMRAAPPSSTLTPASQSEAQLGQACQHQYEHVFQNGLSTAIHNQWLIGEATELGLRTSPAEVRREFNAGKAAIGSGAQFESYRKKTRRTIADIMSEIKLVQLTDKIFEKVKEKERPVTEADVARYYKEHRQQFVLPQGRAVRIVRTATAASATRVWQKLQAGKSFASVAKELSAIGQPLGARNGEVADLKPGYFGEKSLNDAIFKARLHHIYGPLPLTANHKTVAPEANTGYFIFEVTRTTSASQTPLAQVKGLIVKELVKTHKETTIARFVATYRAKWKARTNCQTGYVVQYCSQFPTSDEAVDRYTL